MKSPLALSLLAALAILLAGTTVALPAKPPSDTSEGAQVIQVTAKKYEFVPSTIRVKQGAKIQLKITATDHVHGFKVGDSPEGAQAGGTPGLVFSAPQACYRIEKGQTATIEFVAQTAGTYPFKCCVHCGLHHGKMKGELIVEP